MMKNENLKSKELLEKNQTAVNNQQSLKSCKLSYLSNHELLSRFGRLVQTERKITHFILEYIAEIDARKLYLDKAYPSLYEFLVTDFGYSSSAALRRIESARLLREVPEVAAKIENGNLNLSQLSKVQQALRAVQKLEDRCLSVSEKKQLLHQIEGASQHQTEVILSQALALPIFTQEKAKAHGDESVTMTLTFSKEQMRVLNQARDLSAHAVRDSKWADLITYLAQKEIQRRTNLRKPAPNNIEKASEVLIQKPAKGEVAIISDHKIAGNSINIADNSPVHFIRRPMCLNKNPSDSLLKDAVPTNQKASLSTPATGVVRTALSVSVKKTVLNQQRCCQYRDPKTQKICASTRFLQVDHIHSLWAGGGNERSNLQVLCSRHNRHKYTQEKLRGKLS